MFLTEPSSVVDTYRGRLTTADPWVGHVTSGRLLLVIDHVLARMLQCPTLAFNSSKKFSTTVGWNVAFALAALYADHHEPLIVRHHIVSLVEHIGSVLWTSTQRSLSVMVSTIPTESTPLNSPERPSGVRGFLFNADRQA